MLGLAKVYSSIMTLIAMPTTIPTSRRINSEQRNVAKAGIKSISEINYSFVVHKKMPSVVGMSNIETCINKQKSSTK